jgi:serine phosphatase RsbU (regulator of sigma subunit)
MPECAHASIPLVKVLAQTNNLLCPDMPPKMFVTCLYAILDPASGLLRYSNAGHPGITGSLPVLRSALQEFS